MNWLLAGAVPVAFYLFFVGTVAYKDRQARIEGPARSERALERARRLAEPLGLREGELLGESRKYADYPEYRSYVSLVFTSRRPVERLDADIAAALPGWALQKRYDTGEGRRDGTQTLAYVSAVAAPELEGPASLSFPSHDWYLSEGTSGRGGRLDVHYYELAKAGKPVRRKGRALEGNVVWLQLVTASD